jgi:phospholipid/cholesterol/gamma-HCH transport system ATP-binding protein
MIRVRNLAIGYNGSAVQRRLDFDVQKGEVFLILGGSGCGKSTLLRTLIGLLPSIQGDFELDGVKPVGGEPQQPSFGVLFQSSALFGSLTLEQNVALPLSTWTNLDPDTIAAIVRWKLGLVGLDGFENHMPAELSGGMRKRAGIARALALDPPLLFLDEPGAGLDPVTSADLDALIKTLNKGFGVTVVIVTHELPSIYEIGDRCIMLDRDAGTAIAEGRPTDLRDHSEDPRVRRFFHRETQGHV